MASSSAVVVITNISFNQTPITCQIAVLFRTSSVVVKEILQKKKILQIIEMKGGGEKIKSILIAGN